MPFPYAQTGSDLLKLTEMTMPFTVETSMLSPDSANLEKGPLRPPSYAVARISLIATLLAAPLAFGAVQEWAWGALAVAAFLLPIFWSISGAREGGLRILWSPLLLPAGLFFLLGTIQLAGRLSMDPIATREAQLKLATDLLFFFMAGQLFITASEKTVQAFGSMVAVYAFLLALFAIFQSFSSQRLIYWVVKSPGWTFGPYVNHNHYAGLMEMLFPLTVASVLPAIGKHPSSLLLGFLALIPIASLLLSGSRGGFISLVAEILLAAIMIFLFGPRHARKVVALVGGAAIFATALLFFWMAPRHIAERLATVAKGAQSPEVGLGVRLVVAKDSLGILRDHSWLGTGQGSFETVYPRYQSFPSDFAYDHAHNDYAEALAETGLAGGALVLCAIGLFFWLAFRNIRERLRHRAAWIQFGAALGCCGLLVHSFVDFNLHIPANAAWFAVCAAIATAPQVGRIFIEQDPFVSSQQLEVARRLGLRNVQCRDAMAFLPGWARSFDLISRIGALEPAAVRIRPFVEPQPERKS